MIRSVFPEDDGVYVGYKEGDDDDEDDMAIEVEEAWRDFLDLWVICMLCRSYIIVYFFIVCKNDFLYRLQTK